MKNRVLLNRLVVAITLILSLFLAFYCCLGTINVQFAEHYSHSNNLLFLIQNINVNLSEGSSTTVPTFTVLIFTALPIIFTFVFTLIRIVSIFKINKNKDDSVNDIYGINSIKRLLIETIIFVAFVLFTTNVYGELTLLGYLLFVIFLVFILMQFIAYKLIYNINIGSQINNSLILMSLGLVLITLSLGMFLGPDFVSDVRDFISPFNTRSGDSYIYNSPYTQLSMFCMIFKIVLLMALIIYSFILCKHLPYTKKKIENSIGLIVVTSILFIFSVVIGSLTYAEAVKLSNDGSLLNPPTSAPYLFSLVLSLIGFSSIIILLVSKQIYRKENELFVR